MPGINEAQTSTQTAGETANDISNIMGGMQNAQPGTEPTGAAGGDNGAGTKPNADEKKSGEVNHPAWMAQLGNFEAEQAEKLSKFEKISDLAKNYLDLEGKLGNSIVKPGENASAEEIENFYRSLGKPESADKYSIEGENAESFRKLFYENNLTDAQAKSLYSSLKKAGETALQNAVQAQTEAFETQARNTQAALQKEYGNSYSAKIELLKRGIATYGGQNIGAKLQKAGLLGDYDVVKMFINLGEMSAEAGSPVNTKGKADGYKSIAEGGTLSFGEDFKDK